MDDSTNRDIDDLDKLLQEEITAQNDAAKKEEPKKSVSIKKSKSSDDQNAKCEQKKRPRKPQMKIQLPAIDLDAISPVIPKSPSYSPRSQPFSYDKASESSIADLEKNVIAYLDKSLETIKAEFSSKLQNMLEKDTGCDNIISKFTKDLLYDVERELKFNVTSASMPMIPFNIGIELPKHAARYNSLITPITELKARNMTLNESMTITNKELKTEIRVRNKVFKKQHADKENTKSMLRRAKKKSYKCEISLKLIDAEIEDLRKRTEFYSKKTAEMEANRMNSETEYIPTKRFIEELSNVLPDLTEKIAEPIEFGDFASAFDEEIQDIKRRGKSIENATQEICTAYTATCRNRTPMQCPIPVSQTTITCMPTEDIMSATRNRLSIMDGNQTKLRSPKKRTRREHKTNQSFSTHDKFTLPLTSYVY